MLDKNSTLMVKGKSMVSEEIELNHYLAERDIEAIESDMGEYIVQMAGEKPTHIVMPAIHKTKEQISTLFHEHLHTTETHDVDELIQIGRHALRSVYRRADVGLSGVNFAVAETGTLCLVENEGNGRLCTTVPPVHIAITGIEKSRGETPTSCRCTACSRAARSVWTSPPISTSSPARVARASWTACRKCTWCCWTMAAKPYADEQMQNLGNAFCCGGACMNHCPMYSRIGGAAYGTILTGGPIGEIISPHMMGLEATRDLPTASSLQRRVPRSVLRIPIPELLIRLRTEAQRAPDEVVEHAVRGKAHRTLSEQMVWRAFTGIFAHSKRYKLFSWAATRFAPSRRAKGMGAKPHAAQTSGKTCTN